MKEIYDSPSVNSTYSIEIFFRMIFRGSFYYLFSNSFIYTWNLYPPSNLFLNESFNCSWQKQWWFPIYLIPASTITWTNWPINKVYISKLNLWRIFFCQLNHLYPFLIMKDRPRALNEILVNNCHLDDEKFII